MSDLRLAVKGEYFDAMLTGEKTEEYRLYNDYWRKRLYSSAWNRPRDLSRLIITRGYPKRGDKSRIIDVEYLGYEVKTITHPFFGIDPVKVFAIKVDISTRINK